MFDRLRGRRPALPPAVAAAMERLGRLAESRPELGQLVTINRALLEAMYERPLPALDFALDERHGAIKLEAGQPLLRGERLDLHADVLRDRFIRLCDAMHAQGHADARALGQAARCATLPIGTIALETIDGAPQAMARRVADLGLDAGLGATLLRLTLFPMLEGFATKQRERFDLDRWRRGYCWCCGAWPLLGEYRGLELNRFLRCGLCAAEWEIDRLVCPFCQNRTHQDFINLAVEGEETHQRAVACERCHCYVKQVSTLVAIPAPQLMVEDLATLHLDLIAAERHYMAAQ